jgi:hypothetical protein
MPIADTNGTIKRENGETAHTVVVIDGWIEMKSKRKLPLLEWGLKGHIWYLKLVYWEKGDSYY